MRRKKQSNKTKNYKNKIFINTYYIIILNLKYILHYPQFLIIFFKAKIFYSQDQLYVRMDKSYRR